MGKISIIFTILYIVLQGLHAMDTVFLKDGRTLYYAVVEYRLNDIIVTFPDSKKEPETYPKKEIEHIVNTSCKISTFVDSNYGHDKIRDGIGTKAKFNNLTGIAVDNNRNVFVADGGRIRKISPDGNVSTLVGLVDRFGTEYSIHADRVAVDDEGNVYLIQTFLYPDTEVNKITPDGVVITLAQFTAKNPKVFESWQRNEIIGGVAVDRGIVYVISEETKSSNIRKIINSDSGNKIILAPNKSIRATSIAVDKEGNIFWTDTEHYRIMKINSNGGITTLAGSGRRGSQDANGINASFFHPKSIAVDNKGNVYVVDGGFDHDQNGKGITYFSERVIRKITSSGIVTTLAILEDHELRGVAADSDGNIYVVANEGKIMKIEKCK